MQTSMVDGAHRVVHELVHELQRTCATHAQSITARVACPACRAASNPMALDVAGLWAALHAHLCPSGIDEGDVAITREL